MLPYHHAFLGIIFAAAVYFTIEPSVIGFILIFLASFLIDFDHYLFAAFRNKKISLPYNYRWFIRISDTNKKPSMFFMHTIEFLILTAILAFFFGFMWFVLAGFLFHSVADILYSIFIKKYNFREFSFTRYLIKISKDKNYYF